MSNLTLFVRPFPKELHREIKIQAAKEGITLKELVIKALKEYIKKKGNN